jgi:hypothetical protein
MSKFRGVLSIATLALALAPALATAAAPDHFSCYKAAYAPGAAHFTAMTGVSMVDTFGSSTVTVVKPRFLCAPTDKNGEDPSAPSDPDHLTDFLVKRSTPFTTVPALHVTDQFGSHTIDVKKPYTLQVPSAKSLSTTPAAPTNPAVDHFQCYKMKVTSGTAKFVPVTGVTAQDQFGTITVEVKKPTRFCAPVDKNGEAPGAETHPDYLMCYQVKQTSLPKFAPVSPLFVNHQFGPETFTAQKPMELCIPAARSAAGPTATPTMTAGPGATRTRTPTPNGTQTPSSTHTPRPTMTPGGPCVLPNPIPAVLSYVAKPGVDLDTGWTGTSHDLPGVDDSTAATVRLSNCDTNLSSPTCGQCTTDGPILYPGPSKNCRCTNLGNRDASSLGVCDPEMPSTCSGAETCECYYGPPLPLSSGAVSVCVINRYTSSITGTANIASSGSHSGEGQASLKLEAAVHNGPTVDQPCPVCVNDTTPRDGVKNGTCSGGAKDGQPCDVSGTNIFFGAVSFDCPPLHGANIGNLKVQFNPATTATTTLATNGVKCSGPGFTSQECPCDTCADTAAEACNSNADCPAGVPCGAKRCVGGTNVGTPCAAASECPNGSCGKLGQATAPNQCDDTVCSPDSSNPDTPNDGVCANGPFDHFCSTETFRGCASDSDCNPPPTGSCGNCKPNQICSGGFRNCFLDPIVRTGTPGTQNAILAATFCIPPVSAAAVNSVSGLPGPGGLLQPVSIFESGALCGNGVLDSGETCDPPNDSACPGKCTASCQCPTCGDGHVNQASEQCDGSDDANCPGQCGPTCQCGSTCGNGVVEFGEQCDGAATNGQCPPSACQSDCTCGPYCGDNVVNGSEQCDGSGSTACPPSACRSDCTCGPYCGDGIINNGEQCDGSATGSCPGSCQSDCTCAPFCGNGVREPGELCDGSDAALCPGKCQPDCTCPAIGELSFVVAPGADLDTGWTGTSHDFGVQVGSTIPGVIGACDGHTDTNCTFFGNVGSRCSGDGTISCTDTTQCPVGQTCVINTYGPPLPLSSGGIPVCVVNRFANNVTGSYDTASGSSEIQVPLNSLVYLGTDVNQPCPICNCGASNTQTCTIGQSGTCSDNPARSCTVQGTGPLGPTSNDCTPNPASNISGSGLNLSFNPATTGTSTFASNQPCTGSGFTNQSCWCPQQTQPNACLDACDGGSKDAQPCSTDADCPGAPAGACKPLCRSIAGQTRPGEGVQAVGEAECAAGPLDQSCSGAPQVSCTSDANCVGLGTCVTQTRRCFLDPIVRVGVPSTTSNVFGATFCIPATTSPAVNNTAGLPGPGAIRFPNSLNVAFCGDGHKNRPQEECDGTDDANCPGACQPDCTCHTTCGNNVVEFGEQCDGTAPNSCPGGLCNPPGPNGCTCQTAVCGDGFKAPSEQCDPGGPGGTPPPDDSACPGHCLQGTCQCQPAICGDGVIEPGEVCELPQTGCGPLQVCVGCTQCAP